tara:strand:+ start:439 stop:744 length:306 start_codon:yes stop_codon:yes gene_type:complete
MTITKENLKKFILEQVQGLLDPDAADDNAEKPDSSQLKQIKRGASTGGRMPVEDYVEALSAILASEKVSPQVRLEAFRKVFGQGPGARIHAEITKRMKEQP